MTLGKKPFKNKVTKEENASFHLVYFSIRDKYFHFWYFNLSSANTFNLDKAKIISFGKEFKQITCTCISYICRIYVMFRWALLNVVVKIVFTYTIPYKIFLRPRQKGLYEKKKMLVTIIFSYYHIILTHYQTISFSLFQTERNGRRLFQT